MVTWLDPKPRTASAYCKCHFFLSFVVSCGGLARFVRAAIGGPRNLSGNTAESLFENGRKATQIVTSNSENIRL
jgi:hypothetical protein